MQNKLFVGSLSWGTTLEDLVGLFSEVGKVVTSEEDPNVDTKLMIDRETGRSNGFAFVTMEDEAQAQAVVDKFNDYELDGRKIRVSIAKPKSELGTSAGAGAKPADPRKLFVGSLAWTTTLEQLVELFGQVGTVVTDGSADTKLVMNKETGKSNGYAFVSMSTAEEAQEAISKFDGYELDGRRITVNVAIPRENRAPRMGGGNRFGGDSRGGDRGGHNRGFNSDRF